MGNIRRLREVRGAACGTCDLARGNVIGLRIRRGFIHRNGGMQSGGSRSSRGASCGIGLLRRGRWVRVRLTSGAKGEVMAMAAVLRQSGGSFANGGAIGATEEWMAHAELEGAEVDSGAVAAAHMVNIAVHLEKGSCRAQGAGMDAAGRGGWG